MTTHTTYCRICEALCGLEVEVEGETVVRIRPDEAHVVSKGFGCVKGMRFGAVHHDPDRLRYPMKKGPDGSWESLPWETATREIGRKLARIREAHGPHAIGFYFGNPSAFSYTQPFAMQGFVRGLGTRNVYSAGSQDCNDKFAVSAAMYGSSAIHSVPDFDRVRFLLLLGTNPAVSQMSFVHATRPMEKLEAIATRGGSVVVVDPRRSETASSRHVEHVPIRPDTDVHLLAAIAKRIVERGLVRNELVARHARGYDAFARALRAFPHTLVPELTGVPEATIDRLATELAGERAAIHLSTGVNQGSEGTVAYYLVQAIHLLTGNLDSAGGSIVPEHLLPLPRLMQLAGVDRSPHRSRIGDFEPVLGTMPANILADEILTDGPGKIRALIVTAGNPALSCANSDRMQKALSELELLVTVDLYRNETGELGHYALPALDFLEREDFPMAFLGFQPEPYLQWTEAVVPPKGESRSEWDIVVDLCRESGIPLFGVPGLAQAITAGRKLGSLSPFSPRLAIDAILRSRGSSIAELRANPHGMLRTPNQPGSFLGRRVLTEDGKVDLAPRALVDSLAMLGDRAKKALDGRARDGRLLLFSKREKTSHNSWLHNVEDLVRPRRSTNHAHLHPDDAKERGITDGMRVRVTSEVASIELPAKLDPDVVRGGIAIPHGWGHRGAPSLRVASRTHGVDVNRLAPDGVAHTDRLSGMTKLVGIPVEVVAVG